MRRYYLEKERIGMTREIDNLGRMVIAEESRTIIAEQSPFWSKFSFVAWNT